MIDVTSDIKKAYNRSTTQVDKIIVDNKEYRISNVDYNDDCYNEGNVFGTAIARTLEFEIENTIDLEEKEFEYLTGIYINNEIKWISLGNFITQDTDPNETTNITKITALDYMLKSNIEYKSSLKYDTKLIRLIDVAQEACNQANIVLATTDFANCNFIVDSNQFEEGTLIREVFQAIAQVSGTFAKIRSDNKLYFITPKSNSVTVEKIDNMSVENLDNLLIENFNENGNKLDSNTYSDLVLKRNTHPINLVSLGMSDIDGENVVLRDEEAIEKDGENSLVINDNPFAYSQDKREQLITALFDVVKGFEYTAYEIKGQSKPYLETGDEVIVVSKDETYFYSFLFRVSNKSPNGLESEMSAPSIIKSTVEYQNVADTLDRLKKTEYKVDKQEQKITETIQKIDETSNKMMEVSKSIDEIKQEISNNTDITTVVKGQGVLKANGINESEPIMIKIHPIEYDITPLYPEPNLYPSSNVYPHSRELVFKQVNANEDEETDYIVYDLPANLYYLDENTYDELYMNYENQEFYVVSRVGVDSENNKYALENEVITYFEYPTVHLKGGNYEIYMPSHNTANLEIQLMLKNLYTSQFATEIELNSRINQTESTISESVSQVIQYADGKVGKIEGELALKIGKNDNDEIVSMLNASANLIDLKANRLTMQSDYFQLSANGYIKATAGTIGGWNFNNQYLFKAYKLNNEEFVSGLYCPDKTYYDTVLLYAGAPSGGYLIDANLRILHNGTVYAKDFNVTANGALNFWYENGQIQSSYDKDYIRRYNEDGNKWVITGKGVVDDVAISETLWLYDAQYYQIQDGVHSKPIVLFKRINDDATSNLDIQTFSDIHVWGNRQVDGINNSIYVQGYEVKTNASDRRLKENIVDSEEKALDEINKIQIRSFDWRKDKHLRNGGQHIKNGFIAQEIQKIDDTLVDYDKENDTYQMNLLNLIGLQTKAIQELDNKVENLEKENKKYKSLIEDLESRLEKLEKEV